MEKRGLKWQFWGCDDAFLTSDALFSAPKSTNFVAREPAKPLYNA